MKRPLKKRKPKFSNLKTIHLKNQTAITFYEEEDEDPLLGSACDALIQNLSNVMQHRIHQKEDEEDEEDVPLSERSL